MMGILALESHMFKIGKALRGQTSCLPLVLPESQLNNPQDSKEGPVTVVECT